MKKTKILALVVPLFIIALPIAGWTERVAYADSGGRGGQSGVRGSSAPRSGAGVGVRQGGRDVVTRSGGRGYVGRGGYVGHGGHRHGGHFSGSIWIGPGWGFWDPFFYPYYPYPGYRYYPPPTVVVPQEPQEYILPDAQQEETGYWYYCRNPQGYYPYVERCPSGWMKVVPDTSPPDQDKEKEDKEN